MSITAPEALEKKRRLALERWRRLCCHKNRTLGIDKDALDEQVRARQERDKLEHERDDYFAHQALLMDRHAQVLQGECDDLRREKNKAVEQYRTTFQRKEMSREWDLNDPLRRKGELPTRVCDDDPRLGPSSLQRFEGEDLDEAARRRAQQQQQKRWADEQVDEKLMKKWMERNAERAYQDRAEEMAHRTWQIQEDIAQQRAKATRNTADFNIALADQKRRERELQRQRETQRNIEEIDNMLNSDFLNEIEGTVTAEGERIKRERFRGLTKEQRDAILQQQAEQRAEAARRKEQEAEEERQMAMYNAMQCRMATTLDRQRDRERRMNNMAIAQEQRAQAQEHQQRQRQLKDLYTNAVGEEFFKPFGDCIC